MNQSTPRECFEFDARDLRTARIVTAITPQGGLTSVTRYEHTQHSHAFDAQGRLVASVQASMDESAQEQHVWRYAFDAQQRRVLSQQGAVSQGDLNTGTQRSQFYEGSHRLHLGGHATTYNTNGQPERVGQREYVWDALGRLVEVREASKPLAQYRYDHRGLRIGKTVISVRAEPVEALTTLTLHDESRQPLAELNAQGRITRQYVWLADMPLAVIDTLIRIDTFLSDRQEKRKSPES